MPERVTITEAQAALTAIEGKLAAGVTEATTNGRTVRYDLAALESERARLAALVASLTLSGAAGLTSVPRRVVFRAR